MEPYHTFRKLDAEGVEHIVRVFQDPEPESPKHAYLNPVQENKPVLFVTAESSWNYTEAVMDVVYPSVGNFITAVGIEKYADFNNLIYKGMKKGAKINVQKINMPSGLGLADMSDQRNYWKFGIPGMMINDTAFLRNPNYHQMTDTMDTLDYTKMAEVVNCTVNAVLNI